MLESKRNGISVVNTSMTDVSLDETTSSLKYENGKYQASSKELKEMPSAFRAMLTEFVVTDGVTWLYNEDEVSHILTWDNEKEILEVSEKTTKNKKEVFKQISPMDFAKQMGLEQGINRNIVATITKELIKKALKDQGKVISRGNPNILLGARDKGALKVSEKDIEVVLNNNTKKNVQEIMQAIFLLLEPSEAMEFQETISKRFKKDKTRNQVEKVFNELKTGTFDKFDIGNFVPFTPFTFSALNTDVETLEGDYKASVEYIQDSLKNSELSNLGAKTHIGGYAVGTIPSLNNENMIFDMRMLGTKSAFDKNEDFAKKSETIAMRRELKKTFNMAKEQPSALNVLLKQYEELFNEIMPSYSDKETINHFKNRLSSDQSLLKSYGFLAEVTNTAILDEKTVEQGSYKDLYSMAKTKQSKRPIFANNGLPYTTALMLQNTNDFNVIATANAHQDIKKANFGDSTDIQHITKYEISSIQDKHQLLTISKKKTIPEKIAYMIQDMLKMDEKGEYEYIVKKDGENITKTKVVDVAGNIEKILKTLKEEGELKTNKGVAPALKDFAADLSSALASGNVIEEVQNVLLKEDEIYSPLIEACKYTNTLAVANLSQRSFIANLYKKEINAEVPKIYEKLEENKISDLDYINFTPKAKDKSDRSRHYKAMSGILLSIISNYELAKNAKNAIEQEVKNSKEYKEYVDYCTKNSKEPTQNTIGFYEKIKEAKYYTSALKNRVDGRLSSFNRMNMSHIADSLFLKDGKTTNKGVEYDTKLIKSFDEINKTIKETKEEYISSVKARNSIVDEVIKVLQEKKEERSNNIVDVFNSLEEAQKTTTVKEIAQSVEEKEELVQSMQEAAETVVESTIAPDAVIVEEQATLEEEADAVFGNDIEDEISAMLGDDEEEIDIFGEEEMSEEEELDIPFKNN